MCCKKQTLVLIHISSIRIYLVFYTSQPVPFSFIVMGSWKGRKIGEIGGQCVTTLCHCGPLIIVYFMCMLYNLFCLLTVNMHLLL